jgi:hypothetical protein
LATETIASGCNATAPVAVEQLSLLDEAYAALPLLGHEIGKERFHHPREISRYALGGCNATIAAAVNGWDDFDEQSAAH